MLHPNPAVNRLLWLVRGLLLAAAAVAFYKFLFRPLLPLALAFGLSCLINRPTEWLCRKIKLSRGVCALFLTLLLLAVAGLGLWLLVKLAALQLQRLVLQLPALVENFQDTLSALQGRLERWFPQKQAALPPVLSPEAWLDSLQPPEISLSALADSLGWAASSLPIVMLTAVFFLAATVLLSSQREEVVGFIRRQLPPRLLEAVRRLRRYLSDALTGWLKAQGVLAAVTFCLLLAGFFLLRVPAAGTLALAVALLDALPVLGAGLVLAPWALIDLLAGNYGRGVGVALLLAVVLVVRNGLEPHLVAREIGLHPLVSLISFYLGWRLAGIWGMVFAPICMLILVKLQEWGYSKLWR